MRSEQDRLLTSVELEASLRHQQAVGWYNRGFNVQVYNEAIAGLGQGYRVALIDDAMALCGSPYHVLLSNKWEVKQLEFLALFVREHLRKGDS